MQFRSAGHSNGSSTGRSDVEPGCGRWLLVAAAIGVAAAIVASFTMSAQLGLLAVVLGVLVYACGAIVVALITDNAAIGFYQRLALVLVLPLPVALAVWYGLRLLGF